MKRFALLLAVVSAPSARAAEDCLFGVSEITKRERIECEGSAGQLCGLVKSLSFTVVVKESELPAGTRVNHVGFRDEATGLFTPLSLERRQGVYAYYRGDFRVEWSIFGRRQNAFLGRFELERSDLSVSRLGSGAVRIDSATDTDIRAFTPNLGCFVNGA